MVYLALPWNEIHTSWKMGLNSLQTPVFEIGFLFTLSWLSIKPRCQVLISKQRVSSIILLFVNTQSAGDFNSFCLANTLSIFYGCGVLKINCHTYNSPPEYWKNQYALNQQNKKIPFKIRPYSNFIAGYYIFYGSVRLQIEFIGKKLFQWIHLGPSQVFITFREVLLIYIVFDY